MSDVDLRPFETLFTYNKLLLGQITTRVHSIQDGVEKLIVPRYLDAEICRRFDVIYRDFVRWGEKYKIAEGWVDNKTDPGIFTALFKEDLLATLCRQYDELNEIWVLNLDEPYQVGTFAGIARRMLKGFRFKSKEAEFGCLLLLGLYDMIEEWPESMRQEDGTPVDFAGERTAQMTGGVAEDIEEADWKEFWDENLLYLDRVQAGLTDVASELKSW
ncbi:hypothetical protein BJ508DRAFT_328003 [Ascobolus immersus RN42]|uniref:Uncharacterized protein n=1 Tax=Ascobolus immersus RN42 TaxID=1160509 RepID=A0A3N4I4X7_ASCIM|nr:hypothetical protein BJ508DRAFT_328003 [Ascobolus immersus RN42]